MPTFTAVALERLLEPTRVRDSDSETLPSNKDAKKRPQHIYISPALYTTPHPTPIPHSSSTASVSPSPYVLNRKRRDVPVPEAVNRFDGFQIQNKPQEHSASDEEEIIEGKEEGLTDEFTVERDDETSIDFFDPRDSMSAASCSDTDDLQKHATVAANWSEFYDADEEFSDGSISNASLLFRRNVEVDLHAARVGLFDEIERRKRAEDALAQMRKQWQSINKHLSQGVLSFPASGDAGKDAQLKMDLAENFCQEVIVARFVSEAIGRGQVRAETEAAAEAVIESKNQEISRLRDKLQYYESVNHEMSQRNQEAVEIARRQRHKRKTKQRWIWSCIGMSITLGASVLAYSYFPQTSRHACVATDDLSDTPSGAP